MLQDTETHTHKSLKYFPYFLYSLLLKYLIFPISASEKLRDHEHGI